MSRKIDALLAILVIKLVMELHDLGLHVEDLNGVPDAPWTAMYKPGGWLDFLTYTQHWSLYWGTASILSIVAIALVVLLIRERNS